MKHHAHKGFTLAELLVVVAIIGVLVAVAIPTFSAQLEKARIATDDANLRTAYSLFRTAQLTDEITYVDNGGQSVTVTPHETVYYYLTPSAALTNVTTGSPRSHTYYYLKATHDGCEIGGQSFTHKEGNIVVISCTVSAAGVHTWKLESMAQPYQPPTEEP